MPRPIDKDLAHYARWYAASPLLDWSYADIEKLLRRNGATRVSKTLVGYLMNGNRPITETHGLALAFAKTFALPHGGRNGAREPAYLLALIDPEVGVPRVLHGEDNQVGWFAHRNFAWGMAATLREGGVPHVTAIPAWPSYLEPDVFPVEGEPVQIDGREPRKGIDREGHAIGIRAVKFVYEALGLSDEAAALPPPGEVPKT